MRQIVLALALIVAGCAAARQTRFNEALNAYIGRPVSDIALKAGPPNASFPAGDGGMVFQWYRAGQQQTPGMAMPAFGNVIYYPGQTQQIECRLSVVARTTKSSPTLADWIIERWEYTGNGCV
jgi:hypothetical protein